ncbi:MAG: rRNA maturation RNase YbeY [Acidobacteria bacterium]|nr:rRNA maturation RNase YbeY [Acidobacteriota bacterium]
MIPNDETAWWTNRQRKVRFDAEEFDAFVKLLGRDVARGKPFALVIGSDNEVRCANRLYRGQRGSTDVLSFPDGEEGRLGDILISAARAAKQAEEFGHRVEDELKILALHGLLHLLGYDHESDKGRMRRAEGRWRRKFQLPRALIERARVESS